jgi:hypothetical protein
MGSLRPTAAQRENGMEDDALSESRAGDKQRITFTKNETSQDTDLLWMRFVEAP